MREEYLISARIPVGIVPYLCHFSFSQRNTLDLWSSIRFDFSSNDLLLRVLRNAFPSSEIEFSKRERKKKTITYAEKMKFPSAILFIYLSIYLSTIRTNCDTKLQISSQIRHFRHRVARTSSFPPLLINHTSIRLVNPGIPTPLHTPRLCFIYHLYRVIIVGRYRGSTAEFCPLSP